METAQSRRLFHHPPKAARSHWGYAAVGSYNQPRSVEDRGSVAAGRLVAFARGHWRYRCELPVVPLLVQHLFDDQVGDFVGR